MKIQVGLIETMAKTWHLGVDSQVDGFIGLDANHKFIRDVLNSSLTLAVHITRCVTKLHTNFCLTLVQRLARLEQERHAVPSRVVDEQRHRGKRWAQRTLRDGVVIEVRRQNATIELTSLVLSKRHVINLDRSHRLDHLDLFVANVFGVQARRFLHREQRQNLQQVILHDIANDAVMVKVSTSALGAKIFAKVDLHVTDVVAIPQRLEHDVGKSQHGEIFNQLLSEVVIDTIRLLFAQLLRQSRSEFTRGRQISPEWLLDNHSRVPSLTLTFTRGVLRHRHKDTRRDTQVKHTLHRLRTLLIGTHRLIQVGKIFRLIILPRYVLTSRKKLLRFRRAIAPARLGPVDSTRQRHRNPINKLLSRHPRSRVPVYHKILRQSSFIEQRKQRRVNLLLR
mmetsp:Transcript_4173/g.15289  ORF Transcript_4173/g.15289 Transcript_4173/m.15289 type:complete len:394 (-) Transcript_4173:383-1564(-)